MERVKGGEIMVHNIVKYFQLHPTAVRYSTNCKLMKKSFFIPRQYMRKQRHHLAYKGPYSQTCGFSSSHSQMWEVDHKEEVDHSRTDAFELWCRRRLLGVPWTAKRSNQSILKEIKPEYSLEGPMLKLILQYFGHLVRRANSLEKTLVLGKIEGSRRRGWWRWDGWMASPTRWT